MVVGAWSGVHACSSHLICTWFGLAYFFLFGYLSEMEMGEDDGWRVFFLYFFLMCLHVFHLLVYLVFGVQQCICMRLIFFWIGLEREGEGE